MEQSQLNESTQTELEAAAFRRLLAHLRQHTEVQNIELMVLADFCRNCLSNWYQEAAEEMGQDISKDDAREAIYGMPYDAWKEKHQSEVSDEKLAAFKKASQAHS